MLYQIDSSSNIDVRNLLGCLMLRSFFLTFCFVLHNITLMPQLCFTNSDSIRSFLHLTVVCGHIQALFSIASFRLKSQGKESENSEGEELKAVKVEIPAARKKKPKKTLWRSTSVKTAKEFLHYAFVKNEASYIDKVCRYLFPCCYIIFNTIYWCYYELGSFGKHPPDE